MMERHNPHSIRSVGFPYVLCPAKHVIQHLSHVLYRLFRDILECRSYKWHIIYFFTVSIPVIPPYCQF